MLGPDFAEVLAAAASGDERSFNRLWKDVNPVLLRYLRTLAPAVAEDTASETWLEVVRRLGRFTGDEKGFRSWVFTIARSKVVDSWRRQRGHDADLYLDLAAVSGPAPDDTAGEALEAISTERALRLIATLPKEQAEVVVLRVVVGLDVSAVAALVGCSPGAVRVRQHRGLRRLAQVLEQAGAVTP